MIKEDDLFKIGQVTKPHGIKGEISLLTDYDISGISGNPYIVCNMDGIWVPFFIRSYRKKSNTITLLKIEDMDSEDDAKLLTGKEAYVPLKMLPSDDHTLTCREYIAGYTVIENKSGEIGQVKGVDDSTLNVLLKVDYKGNEILIPVALVTAIHQEHKTIEASLPEGFLEL